MTTARERRERAVAWVRSVPARVRRGLCSEVFYAAHGVASGLLFAGLTAFLVILDAEREVQLAAVAGWLLISLGLLAAAIVLRTRESAKARKLRDAMLYYQQVGRNLLAGNPWNDLIRAEESWRVRAPVQKQLTQIIAAWESWMAKAVIGTEWEGRFTLVTDQPDLPLLVLKARIEVWMDRIAEILGELRKSI